VQGNKERVYLADKETNDIFKKNDNTGIRAAGR